MNARCQKRCPNAPIPPSMTVESAAVHPGFKHLLELGAQCELDPGHGGDGTREDDLARRHRNGLLVWWDPPLFQTGRAA